MKSKVINGQPTTNNEAIARLLLHQDPEVKALAVVIKDNYERRQRILDIAQEALSQLRVDMKYLIFDLECTRQERDSARAGGKD